MCSGISWIMCQIRLCAAGGPAPTEPTFKIGPNISISPPSSPFLWGTVAHTYLGPLCAALRQVASRSVRSSEI